MSREYDFGNWPWWFTSTIYMVTGAIFFATLVFWMGTCVNDTPADVCRVYFGEKSHWVANMNQCEQPSILPPTEQEDRNDEK